MDKYLERFILSCPKVYNKFVCKDSSVDLYSILADLYNEETTNKISKRKIRYMLLEFYYYVACGRQVVHKLLYDTKYTITEYVRFCRCFDFKDSAIPKWKKLHLRILYRRYIKIRMYHRAFISKRYLSEK